MSVYIVSVFVFRAVVVGVSVILVYVHVVFDFLRLRRELFKLL
jgi:hypothetical protein